MPKSNDRPAPQQYQSIFSIFAKAYWTLLGNSILFISAAFIVQHKGSALHTADLVFWANLAAMLGARYLDIKFWSGTTAAGRPATVRHWRRYAAVLLAVAAVAWVVLHIINMRLVNPA